MKININSARATLEERRQMVFSHNYKWKDETIPDMFKRVATVASKGDEKLFNDFYEGLSRGFFVPAGRIMRTVGRDDEYGLPYNCYACPSPKDDLNSIFDMKKVVAKLLQKQGGVGILLDLRPKGAKIKTSGGVASGVVTFAESFQHDVQVIKVGANRRGALLIAINVDHPDVKEFITVKRDTTRINSANISVLITDEFVEAVKADKPFELKFDGEVFSVVQARELWNLIVESNYECGEPGIIFMDRVRKTNNTEYFQPVKIVNACWSGDTKILTANGLKTFKELVNSGCKETLVKGEEMREEDDGLLATAESKWCKMKNIRKTGKKRIVEITLFSGVKLRCTYDHKLYRVEKKVRREFLRRNEIMSDKKRLGGEGTPLHDGIIEIAEQSNLSSYSMFREQLKIIQAEEIKPGDLLRGFYTSFDEYFDIALHEFYDSWKTEYDKCKGKPEGCAIRRIYEKEKDVMDGVASAAASMLKVSVEEYKKSCGEHAQKALESFEEADKSSEGVDLVVESVRFLEQEEDVYNAEVPATHNYYVYYDSVDPSKRHGLGCMLLSKNCSEQVLPASLSDDGKFVVGACNLGSLNIYKIWKASTGLVNFWEMVSNWSEVLVEFLDNIIDIAEERIEMLCELEDDLFISDMLRGIAETQKQARRVGVGVMGVHSVMITRGVTYGDQDSCKFVSEMMKCILLGAYNSSSNIASKKGSFPAFDLEEFKKTRTWSLLDSRVKDKVVRNGLRNSQILSIAPTGNTSVFAGGVSSGIEPVFDVEGSKRTDSLGEHVIYDPAVIDYFEGNPNAPSDMPVFFVSAMDIPLSSQVDVLDAVIKYIESNVSKTVNAPRDISIQEVQEVYDMVLNSDTIKSLTFYRDGTRNNIISKAKRKRPSSLDSKTFKRRFEGDSYFVTIGMREDGFPYEIFTTCRKNNSVRESLLTLTIVLHHALKNCNDVHSLLDLIGQMKDISDNTKHYDSFMQKDYSSLVSSLGDVLEEYLKIVGLLEEKKEKCPNCGRYSMEKKNGGCAICLFCSYSACSV